MASSNQQSSLNNLLQWSIANSTPTTSTNTTAFTSSKTNETNNPNPNPSTSTSHGAQRETPPRENAHRGLDSKMLSELLGGPSDADLMRESMTAILAPAAGVPLAEKLVAWDNFEQLIEQLDNANNLEAMGLWPPLLAQLEARSASEGEREGGGGGGRGGEEEGEREDWSEMRLMAAWCISTAVQNNVSSQEKLLAHGGIAKLAKVAIEDEAAGVRKKAINALSSAVRNFQPGLDELEASLPAKVWRRRKPGLDAAEMDSVDEIIQVLRDASAANAG